MTPRVIDHEQLRPQLAAFMAGKMVDDPYQLLSDVIESEFFEAAPALESCLRSEDEMLRAKAIYGLVGNWSRAEHRGTAERMAVSDPSPDVRGWATIALRALLWGTRDPAALKVAVGLLEDDDEEPRVRSAAYDTVIGILGGSNAELPKVRGEFEFARDVNPGRLAEARALINAARG